MVQEYGLFIDGKWRTSEGKRFETRNPATGEVLATFPLATNDELGGAAHAAKGAFERWRKTPAPRRGEILLEAARIFRRKKEELGRVVTTEMGKVIAEGRGDVQEVIDFYEYAAGEGRRMFGETVPSELPNKMCLTVRIPVGPVGLITPWNFPMAIPAWKSGAALIAGCPMVLKPSSLTPLCGAKFVEVLDEAGFPPGVVNLLTGSGSVVGDGIVGHPDIRAVSFTGGVDTGKHVYEAAAKKILEHIAVGVKEGDELLTGGKKLRGGAYDKGFFIEPTVFAVDRKSRLAQEEIFGPVLSVLKAKDYEDAIAIANSVKYGLSSSIYTNDLRRAFRAMHELEAGITYVNAPTIGAEVQLPFGGIKETGPTDTREAGTTALEEFTYWKTIYVDYSGRLQRAQIDTEKLVGS